MNLTFAFQIPKKDGIYDFSGTESQRVFDHLADMSLFGIRLRCGCNRDYDDPAFFRTMSSFSLVNKKQIKDWGDGLVKHPAFFKCRRCKTDFVHRLEIPQTTWMMVVHLYRLRILDIGNLPRFVTTISKPTEFPENDVVVTWRLAYISGLMPIPHDPDADHLVSLQFLYCNGNMTRYYFESVDDGILHPDSASERIMTDGQLLKKKCNDVLLTSPVVPGKDITRRPQFAVYFRTY